ncbi:hypothetical protein V9K67_08620 [Paraflavisolibacter sp. H34]|uniref:hypothetical protein n=1 Tax=Huijunlia imazamoxiresistens TaxID=3127457 RepID=UPI00301B0F8C
MIPHLRQQYNAGFTPEKYAAYLHELGSIYPGSLEFRLAETPVFVPSSVTRQMIDTAEAVVDLLLQPGYRQQSERAIPPALRVPNETPCPEFMVLDFGLCRGASGAPEPRLIELQGFPSLFAWHLALPEAAARHFSLPAGFSPFLNGFDRPSYVALLRHIIVGDHRPENVVLLELFPHRQKTRVDFYATRDLLGVHPVCLTEISKEGKNLYYYREGKKTAIHRIYNRLIFDELLQQAPEVREKGKILQEELDVEWVVHPNWFYRLSKFTLPFLQHPCVPETAFLNELETLPPDLENYVLKPLFSFSGQGVVIDVTGQDIERITDGENWILQKKVDYAPLIQTPDEGAKAELRLFYFWPPGAPRPLATNNLARLSKGKMIGVNYNKDKDWVGGSFCLFESGEK